MNKKPLRKILQGPLMYLLLLAIILLMVHMLSEGSRPQTQTLSYSALLEWVEADLKHSQGEKLSSDEQGKTLARVVIQTSTLMGVTEENLAGFELTGNYDIKCVVPSETQFYKDVGTIYENYFGHAVSPTEYDFEITSKLPATPAWWV